MPSGSAGPASVRGGGIGGLIRRHPFASFYLLAVAFPTLLFTYLFLLETLAPNMYGPGVGTLKHFYATLAQLKETAPLLTQHRDSVLLYLTLYSMIPLGAPFFFFPFAPTLSALVMTGLARGGAALRALIGAYAPLRGGLGWREGVRIYGLLLLALAGLFASAMLYDALFQGGGRLAQMGKTWGLGDLTPFLAGWGAALFLNQGALLEELGWRGYAWPVLVRKLGSPLKAALLLAIAWALWHFPREIPILLSGEQTPYSLLAGQALFITSCIGVTLVAVAFVNVTGGSVLPAIMIHGAMNTLYMGFEAGRTGVRSDFTFEPPLFWAAAGLITLLVMGRDLGWQRRMQIHGGDGRSDPANLWASRP